MKAKAFSVIATSLIGITLTAAVTGNAKAAVVISFDQVGPNVVATTSGSLTLAGLSPAGSGFISAGAINPQSFFVAAPGSVDRFGFISPTTSFGPGDFTTASFSSGTAFGISSTNVLLPTGYVSGTPLAATTTFLGASFATLGITPGIYVFSTQADAIYLTVQANIAAVPEPSTWAMMLMGFGGLGLALRRRRKLTANAQIV